MVRRVNALKLPIVTICELGEFTRVCLQFSVKVIILDSVRLLFTGTVFIYSVVVSPYIVFLLLKVLR